MGDVDRLFAERVRKLRRQVGLSQAALSEKAGLGARYCAQLESGTRGASVRSAVQVARALGVPVAALLEGAESAVERRPVLRRIEAILAPCADDDLVVIERALRQLVRLARRRVKSRERSARSRR